MSETARFRTYITLIYALSLVALNPLRQNASRFSATGCNKVAIKYLRMMKADVDQLPLVMRGVRDCLAVRSEIEANANPDNPVDVLLTSDGQFIHLLQGLSLTRPPKTNIPRQLFQPKRGLCCYGIDVNVLDDNEHLMFIVDSPKHAMIVPRHDMHIQEYELYLEATRHLWEVQNDEEE